jgi:hypothetical protein
MYRIAKKPEVPSSTPDKITFPFDFSEFGFTMENYVRSFTRNRVSKEKILEVLDEVNATIQAEKENFNTWDTISLVLFILGSLVALYCLLTLRLKDLTIWLIKFLLIIVTIIFNICIWGYCQSGAISRMKSKIQFILDSQEDVYEEKGMKWSLSNENEFPFWIELHIQSEYEMKVDKNDKGKRGKGSKDLRLADHNTTIDSFEDDTEIISKRSLRKNFKEDHDEDEDGDDVRINVQRGKSKEREIEIQDKKYDNSPKIENSYQQQVDEDEDDDEAHIEEGRDDDDLRSV